MRISLNIKKKGREEGGRVTDIEEGRHKKEEKSTEKMEVREE